MVGENEHSGTFLNQIADAHQEKTVETAFDREMMQRCLQLARRALGRTAPNPLVGSVIVQNEQIVGEGFIQELVSLMQKFMLSEQLAIAQSVPQFMSTWSLVITTDGLPLVQRR